ncbi:MAG: glycosyltransferase [Deltaproteobacteria bacterium]|nr:glycosyltransferase [Deltaproteobacteria bacterium]
MVEKNKIFIGFDPGSEIAYHVLKYSIEKHASRPVEISPLRLKDIVAKTGFRREKDPLATTEFTYTRFLVPYLCGFKGKALFMDNDMLCFSDINELFDLDLDSYWLRVVKHNYHSEVAIKLDGRPQTNYPRKNWSSLMLLNCKRLTCWSKEDVEMKPASWLHRFEPIPDEFIGEIPKGWNVLERYDESTKLIHYTEGGPWYENHKSHPYGKIWFHYRDEMKRNS